MNRSRAAQRVEGLCINTESELGVGHSELVGEEMMSPHPRSTFRAVHIM